MNKNILLISATIIFQLVFITTNNAAETGKPVASANNFDVKQHLVEITKNLKQLQANFVQTKHLTFISSPLISTGDFLFVKNKGLLWKIQTPYQSQTLINKYGVFQRNNDKFVMTNDPQMRAVSDIISQTFSANFSEIEKNFEFIGNQNNNIANDKKSDMNNWQFKLMPKTALLKKVLTSIEFYGKNNQITTVIINYQQQNTTSLELKNSLKNQDIAPNKLALFDIIK